MGGHGEWLATLLRPDMGCCSPDLELPHLQVDKSLFGRRPREAGCGCREVRRGREETGRWGVTPVDG